ncbi:MAG: hypothetical protein GTO63_13560 [Anaerolineae bacterium]|nr:hypothetical protein [Anaerolineae bacterium]NIN95877.1 hypothetical protein [Anaerolineae bacterium]NIQ78849.1 hypothetical protein [Anaerolineae bacterium]
MLQFTNQYGAQNTIRMKAFYVTHRSMEATIQTTTVTTQYKFTAKGLKYHTSDFLPAGS